MNFSSVTLYKETLSKTVQVPVAKLYRFRWGKTTSDVSSRSDISYSAKVLMDVFSQWGKGREIVALSNGRLAEAMGGSRTTVIKALKALEKAKLIEKAGMPAGHEQIQAYRMLHPALVRTAAPAPAEVKRTVGLRACKSCLKPCVPGVNGLICKACCRERKLDEKIRRISREVHEGRNAG